MLPNTTNHVNKFLKSNWWALRWNAFIGIRQARGVLEAARAWRESGDDDDLLALDTAIVRYCVWLLRRA